MLPSKEGFGTMPLSPERNRRDESYTASYFLGEEGVCVYGWMDVRDEESVCVYGWMDVEGVNMGWALCVCTFR